MAKKNRITVQKMVVLLRVSVEKELHEGTVSTMMLKFLIRFTHPHFYH